MWFLRIVPDSRNFVPQIVDREGNRVDGGRDVPHRTPEAAQRSALTYWRMKGGHKVLCLALIK